MPIQDFSSHQSAHNLRILGTTRTNSLLACIICNRCIASKWDNIGARGQHYQQKLHHRSSVEIMWPQFQRRFCDHTLMTTWEYHHVLCINISALKTCHHWFWIPARLKLCASGQAATESILVANKATATMQNLPVSNASAKEPSLENDANAPINCLTTYLARRGRDW